MDEKLFCMQCQSLVDKDKMTWCHTGKVRRRMCEECKSSKIDRMRAENEQKKARLSGCPV